MSKSLIKIQWRVTDLWRDKCGWSENGATVRQGEFWIDPHKSDLAINRRNKSEAGIQGWRCSLWCCADFGPWRYGFYGAYADIVA